MSGKGHPGTVSRRAVAEALRQLRERAGLSQRELARRLGFSHRWVQTRESGRTRVELEEYVRWARACGGDPQEWFDRLMDGE